MILVDERGRRLRLGEKLGGGGEGAVYRLADHRSTAIKMYSSPPSGDRIRKVETLAQYNGLEVQRYTAWPSGLVFDQDAQLRGFLLPVVEHGKDIHYLYTPSTRRTSFPGVDWRFLVHVSANVARAFAAVHKLGLVIGDVNPSSILVLPDGTVRLIDVDSFQVPVPGRSPFLCTVAVPLFLPPELKDASLSSVVRTTHHDTFGLAITVFQLLLLGRHPYAGRFLGVGDMSIERAISEHRFAYGRQAAVREMQRPPNTVGMEILPGVASLFEAAFAPEAPGRGRPSASDWVRALSGLSGELVRCRTVPSHYHFRELARCPWCPLEDSTGVVLFDGHAPKPTGVGRESEYRDLLRMAIAVARPQAQTPASTPSAFVPQPAAQIAAKVPRSAWTGYLVGSLFIIVGGLLLLGGPVGVPLILVGALVLTAGVRARRRRRTPWIAAYMDAKSEYDRAARQLEEANRFPDFGEASTRITQATRTWEDLPRRREEWRRRLEAGKRQLQLRQFLESRLIEHASIRGFGPTRLAMLSSYGIDTAYDVEPGRIVYVPGIGQVLAERLLLWRRGVERSFVYDASRPVPAEALSRLERKFDDECRSVIESLRTAVRDLRTAASAERTAAARAAERVTAAAQALGQARVDVQAATG